MQLNYAYNPPIAKPGMLADSGYTDKLTYNNPTMAIPFGRALFKILGDEDGVILPLANTADRVVGVSIDTLTEESGEYPAKSAISGLRKGRIYVQVEEAVTPDDAVYVRYGGVAQVQTITFDIDFVTGNKINMKINGLPITEVLFDTNQATTMTALDAAITAIEGVANVTTLGKVVTITAAADTNLVITDLAVTEGADQAVGVVAETVKGRPLADRGKFRKTADGGTAFQLTKCKWTKGAAADGFAVLDFNLP